MPSFILRDLNPEFWARVQAKATAEGTTVKAVILRLLTQWLAVAVLAGLSVACGYKNPTGPSPEVVVPTAAVAAAIQLQASSQTDHTIALAAKVTTADGRFLSGVAVSFTTSTGTLSLDSALTDAAGLAHTVLTSNQTATIGASAGTLSATTTLASSVPPVFVPPPSIPGPVTPAPLPPSVPQPAPTPTPVPAPTPTPEAPMSVTVGCTVTGKTIGCNASASRNGVPVTTQINFAQWHFGDGNLQETTVPLVTKTYALAGTYTVYVIVRLTDGSTGNAATEVVIP